MEQLIAAALLWINGLGTYEEYNCLLDEKFLENPDSDILLELEWCSSDCKSTFRVLYNFWTYEYFETFFEVFKAEEFGKTLLYGLESVYNLNSFSLAEFGRRCNQLSDCLPQELIHVEPYVTLICAVDYTSIGYEEAARELYEKAFSFYSI